LLGDQNRINHGAKRGNGLPGLPFAIEFFRYEFGNRKAEYTIGWHATPDSCLESSQADDPT
jgi:hypothetical protein